MQFSIAPFGCLPDGRTASLYVLENARGMTLAVTDYGARVVRLTAPDRNGAFADVALGHDAARGYLTPGCGYFGATCGPVANRISGGAFVLDGKRCTLDANERGVTTLHGGGTGFSGKIWEAAYNGAGVQFSYRRPDGEGGFPGTLDVTVTYVLTEDGAVRIRYEAVSDRDTPVNLTNHTYFHLGGHGSGDICAHMLRLDAPWMTPVDAALIPTGETRSVAGTAFDFRTAKPLAEAITSADPDIRATDGLDHNFILSGGRTPEPRLIGTLSDPASGRIMEIRTTEPCVQVYTTNKLARCQGKGGAVYEKYGAVCLETQRHPNAVNTAAFPSIVLHASDTYAQETEYRFVTM